MTDRPLSTYNREIFHGGDLTWAKKNFGADGPAWIDLSTGINPVAYPVPPLPQDVWTRLPGIDLEESLLAAAKRYYGLPDGAEIVACPGTQSALQHLPRLIERTSVAILSPTYAEHAKCWKAEGHSVLEAENLRDIPSSAKIVVLVTPNNPTGAVADIEMLDALRQQLIKKGGMLVLDEAFMDMTPARSYSFRLPQKGIVILKSFGKFFGLAGLRLGFVLGDEEIISRLKNDLGPWAVSGPAAYIGRQAFNDTDWVATMRERLGQKTRKLTDLLVKSGLPIAGATDLFTLVQTDQADALFKALCAKKILTRPFPDQPDFLRFGLPGEPDHWHRLERALNVFKNRSPRIKQTL